MSGEMLALLGSMARQARAIADARLQPPPKLPGPTTFEIAGVDECGVAKVVQAPLASHTSSPEHNVGGSYELGNGERQIILQTVMGISPQTITISLIRRDNPSSGERADDPDVDVDVYCELLYGAGGATERVRLDWLNGMLLTVPAGSVTVGAHYERAPGGEFVGGPDPLRQYLGAVATLGTRPPAAGNQPLARLTSRLGTLDPTDRVGIVVPARAHAFQLTTTFPEDMGSYLVEADTASVAATPRRILASWNTMGGETALPNATRKLWITNNGSVGARLSIIWSIAL